MCATALLCPYTQPLCSYPLSLTFFPTPLPQSSLSLVFTRVCVCVWRVCICVCVCACVCMCIHVCDIHRGQRTSPGAALSSTSSLRLLSPCLEFIQLLADQQTPSLSCLCLHSIGNIPLPPPLIFLCRVSGLPTWVTSSLPLILTPIVSITWVYYSCVYIGFRANTVFFINTILLVFSLIFF